MLTISLESEDNLASTAEKIRQTAETEVELPVASVFPFTQNLVNLKILRQEAESAGKKLTFLPKDEVSLELIANLTNGENKVEAFGFVSGREIPSAVTEVHRKNSLKETFLKIATLIGKPFLLLVGARSYPLSLMGLGLIALLIVGGIFLFLVGNFWPQTTVTLTISSENLTRSIDLEASPATETTDPAKKIIPAAKMEGTLKGKGQGVASGQKEVGEKATGTVVIYNKTDKEQTLKKGTPLRKITVEAGADLTFLLNSDLKTPPREAVITPQPGYVFGRVSGAVTAEKIGENYNLSSATTFSVGDFPTGDLTAQNDQGFSGGSKRTVKIVAKEDQEKTLNALTTDLQEKLKMELRSRLVGDQKLEEDAITFAPLKKSFDKSVGEEAETFNLDLEEEANALVYSQGELEKVLTALLTELAPSNYELAGEDQVVSVTAVPRQHSDNVLKLTAKVRGYIVPKLDSEKIKKDLAGQTFSQAESYLQNLPNVDAHRIILWPNLPFLKSLPRAHERITVEIERK